MAKNFIQKAIKKPGALHMKFKCFLKNIRRKYLHGTERGWLLLKKEAYEIPGVKEAYFKYKNNILMSEKEAYLLVINYTHFLYPYFDYDKLKKLTVR